MNIAVFWAGSNPVTPIDEMLYKTANEPVLLAHYLFVLYILICPFVEYIRKREDAEKGICAPTVRPLITPSELPQRSTDTPLIQ